MRLGTSSPKMIVNTVMITTTRPVALSAAAPAGTWKAARSQTAKGSANAASPTMPFMIPIEVMPICTVERNLVGLSCSAIAASTPGSPASSMT